jgi:hypothetical protein
VHFFFFFHLARVRVSCKFCTVYIYSPSFPIFESVSVFQLKNPNTGFFFFLTVFSVSSLNLLAI